MGKPSSKLLGLRVEPEQHKLVTVNAYHRGYETVSAALRALLEGAGYFDPPPPQQEQPDE